MQISFKPNDDDPFHKDIHVVIPEIEVDQFVDAFYFAIDQGFLPEEDTYEKVQMSLTNLLHEWIEAIDSLGEGAITYLPFDFSDQYVGALRVQRNGKDVIIRYAWNRPMGGMKPSYFKSGILLDKDFIIEIRSDKIPLVKLILDIEQQIDCA